MWNFPQRCVACSLLRVSYGRLPVTNFVIPKKSFGHRLLCALVRPSRWRGFAGKGMDLFAFNGGGAPPLAPNFN